MAILEQMRIEQSIEALTMEEAGEDGDEEEQIEEAGFGNEADGYQSDESMVFE